MGDKAKDWEHMPGGEGFVRGKSATPVTALAHKQNPLQYTLVRHLHRKKCFRTRLNTEPGRSVPSAPPSPRIHNR